MSQPAPKDAQLYIAQKAFIRKGNQVLVLHDPHEGLDFPGGKIQEGEADTIASLKREVLEETGLDIIVGRPFATWTEVFPPHRPEAGQRVYLVGYHCEYIPGDITLSAEHDNFRWVSIGDYMDVQEDTQYFAALKKYFSEVRE